MIKLKDGSKVKDARLDRIVSFDEKSRLFCVMDVVSGKPKSVAWDCVEHLDQGREGMCVGCGVTHEAIADPVPVKGLDITFAKERIYWVAQKLDGIPGGSYPLAFPRYEGTSVLAGLKAGKIAGLFDSYYWSFSLDELIAGMEKGPSILGVAWTDGMSEGDEKGFIHYTGKVRGGHCILGKAVNIEEEYFVLHNSWGLKWNKTGDAKISFKDMEKLLHDDGESAFVSGRHKKPNNKRGKYEPERSARVG